MTHINRAHPVRAILEAVANGQEPTKAFLDQMLVETSNEHLPEGESLDKFRPAILTQATVIKAHRAQGDNAAARNAADEAASTLAERMTPAQRALKSSDTTSSEAAVNAAVAAAFNK